MTGYVNVRVTSSLTSIGSECRYQTSITVRELKVIIIRMAEEYANVFLTPPLPPSLHQSKLELVTGATAALCELEVYDSENKLLHTLDDDEAKLSSFPLDDGYRVHVRELVGQL